MPWKDEREVLIGGNRLYLDGDNILYGSISGRQDEETTLATKGAFLTLLAITRGKVRVLADDSRSGRASLESRDILRALYGHEHCERLAISGLDALTRIIASIVIRLYRKNSVRVFSTREAALDWLRDGKKVGAGQPVALL